MSGQRVGYTRVSSLDQNADRQLDGVALDRVFTDSASGRSTARPQLEALLAFVRDGDTVLVHSMDRLARNLDDLRSGPHPDGPGSAGAVRQGAADLHRRGHGDGDVAAVGDGGIR